MANNYLSKRELTEMITREVKAALKQPNRRTLRENEVDESVLAALGHTMGHLLDPAAWHSLAEMLLKSPAENVKAAVSLLVDPNADIAKQVDQLSGQLQGGAGGAAIAAFSVVGGFAPQIKAKLQKLADKLKGKPKQVAGEMKEGADDAEKLEGILAGLDL
jgi:hypothetical protein